MSEHWAELLMEDHRVIEKVLATFERTLAAGAAADPAVVAGAMTFLVEYAEGCHNKKEEDHLFPRLESRGLPRTGGPLAVMLAEHEQQKTLLSDLRTRAAAFAGGDAGALPHLRRVFGQYTQLLQDHFWKENDILYPMGRRVLSEQDDAAIVAGIGATEAALGPDTRRRYYAMAEQLASGVKNLVHNMDLDLLGRVLDTLPVELSFVDADDTVRYFSHEDQEKIFPRLRSAIGMNVRSCHPQKSLHLVEKIIADFRAGTRDVAEFWLDFQGKKVHVRYFAVRSATGGYLGTLETVQDVTGIQGLAGERRLLDDA